MSNFFDRLNQMEQEQKQGIRRNDKSGDTTVFEQNNAQETAQNGEQETEYLSNNGSKSTSRSMSKSTGKKTSKSMSICIEAEDVEKIAFETRKQLKAKVSTDIPIEWRDDLHAVCLELGVGKYDFVAYLIGHYLGKIKK